MATLKAHGELIGKVDVISKVKAYMSDGTILVNHGFGWKVGPALKAGVDIRTAYAHQVEFQRRALADRPAYSRWHDEIVKAAGIGNRWMLINAIEAMPEDPDGVWSTLEDHWDAPKLDLDELVGLCRTYLAMLEEANLARAQAARAEGQ